eukprot:COSAG01_NODE_3368_length_6183_cov_4.978143_2_plen_714_part_00
MYRAIRPVKVTDTFALGSATIKSLEEGEEVLTIATKSELGTGRKRVKLQQGGWVSISTKQDAINLEEVPLDDSAADEANVTPTVDSQPIVDDSSAVNINGNTLDGTDTSVPQESADLTNSRCRCNKERLLQPDITSDLLVIGFMCFYVGDIIGSISELTMLDNTGCTFSGYQCSVFPRDTVNTCGIVIGALCIIWWLASAICQPHSSSWVLNISVLRSFAFDKATVESILANRAITTYMCFALGILFSWSSVGAVFAVTASTLAYVDRAKMQQEEDVSSEERRPEVGLLARRIPPFFVASYVLAQMQTFEQFGGAREATGSLGKLAWLCFAIWCSRVYLEEHSAEWACDKIGGYHPTLLWASKEKLWASLGFRAYTCAFFAMCLNQWTTTAGFGLPFAILALVTTHNDCACARVQKKQESDNDGAPLSMRDQVAAIVDSYSEQNLCCGCAVGDPSKSGLAYAVCTLIVVAFVRVSSVRTSLSVYLATVFVELTSCCSTACSARSCVKCAISMLPLVGSAGLAVVWMAFVRPAQACSCANKQTTQSSEYPITHWLRDPLAPPPAPLRICNIIGYLKRRFTTVAQCASGCLIAGSAQPVIIIRLSYQIKIVMETMAIAIVVMTFGVMALMLIPSETAYSAPLGSTKPLWTTPSATVQLAPLARLPTRHERAVRCVLLGKPAAGASNLRLTTSGKELMIAVALNMAAPGLVVQQQT